MKFRLRVFLIAIFAVALATTLCELTFHRNCPDVFSQGSNAIWLRHAWIGATHSPEEYHRLADQLTVMKITDAYFHAGPLRADGTVDPGRIRNACELVQNMKALCPNVRLQAYLGQLEASGGGPLKLSSAIVRSRVIQTASTFLDLGFDGIHYDIEPIHSGDPNFLTLLRDTRKLTRERHAFLSVSACKPQPVPGMAAVAGVFFRFPGYWTKGYFLEVAREVDQIAIMSYDAAYPSPSLYGRMISRMVRWCVSEGLNNVLIGIPTYKEATPSHSPRVENLSHALLGLKQGLARVKPLERVRVGAAVFAEWTTSEQDRRDYCELWISR